MRIVNRRENEKPETALTTAVVVCLAAGWMLAATAGLAQNAPIDDPRTGVSHPDQAPITVDQGMGAVNPSPAKPSADIPAPAPDTSQIVYGPYVPYHAPGTPVQAPPAATANASPFNPDGSIVTEATIEDSGRRPLADPDAGIVTSVPLVAGEVPDGTLVKVSLNQALSTLTTQPGTKFSASVSAPVMRDGQVIVPVGSTLEGRVTWVRGGKRIGGPAGIHLEPETVVLPDGTEYFLRAQAIDTDRWGSIKVDSEGTILRRDNAKKTAAAFSLATGGGIAAGAMMGGVPGAVIGAGVGAGVGTVVWLKQDRQANLPRNLGVVFSLTEPMDITPARAAVVPARLATPGGE